MNGRLNLAVTLLLVLCALALVNAQYHARSLFIAFERAQAAARQLDIEWAQLQLDQSTLGKHARIEAAARHELHMLQVSAARTQYLVADGLAAGSVPADATGAGNEANTGTNTGANSGARSAESGPAPAATPARKAR